MAHYIPWIAWVCRVPCIFLWCTVFVAQVIRVKRDRCQIKQQMLRMAMEDWHIIERPFKRAKILHHLEPPDFPHLSPSGWLEAAVFPMSFGTIPKCSHLWMECVRTLWCGSHMFHFLPDRFRGLTPIQEPAVEETALSTWSTDNKRVATPVVLVDQETSVNTVNNEDENKKVTDLEAVVDTSIQRKPRSFRILIRSWGTRKHGSLQLFSGEIFQPVLRGGEAPSHSGSHSVNA